MKTLDNVNTFLFIHLWACQFLLTIQEMFEMEQNTLQLYGTFVWYNSNNHLVGNLDRKIMLLIIAKLRKRESKMTLRHAHYYRNNKKKLLGY
ncbi:hypothetical protein BLOT_000159 [Blomia tropicalis]|nr:hypothetical protein BLOT_000159 [Blomia tropicalis]